MKAARTPQHPSSSSDPAALERECTQLTESVRRLTQERDSLRQMVAALQVERDDYQKIVYALLKREFPEDDWRDFREEDYSLSSADILELLEQLQGKAHG